LAFEEWKSRNLGDLVARANLGNDWDDSCTKRKKYDPNGAATPINVAVVEEIHRCHHISYDVDCLKDKFKKEEAEDELQVLDFRMMIVNGRCFFLRRLVAARTP
jgi:hypothetical protein